MSEQKKRTRLFLIDPRRDLHGQLDAALEALFPNDDGEAEHPQDSPASETDGAEAEADEPEDDEEDEYEGRDPQYWERCPVCGQWDNPYENVLCEHLVGRAVLVTHAPLEGALDEAGESVDRRASQTLLNPPVANLAQRQPTEIGGGEPSVGFQPSQSSFDDHGLGSQFAVLAVVLLCVGEVGIGQFTDVADAAVVEADVVFELKPCVDGALGLQGRLQAPRLEALLLGLSPPAGTESGRCRSEDRCCSYRLLPSLPFTDISLTVKENGLRANFLNP